MNRCPNCGYCPHCGHTPPKPALPLPQPQGPWVQPWRQPWGQPYVTWTANVSNAH